MSVFNIKSWRYGAPIDPQSYNRQRYSQWQKQAKTSLNDAVAQQQSSDATMQGYAQQQHDFWMQNGVPLQQKLFDQATADLNPDNAAIDAQTSQDAQASRDVNQGMMDRQYTRMGIAPNADADRKLGLAQALGQASAANSTRDAMINRGTAEAQSLAVLGGQQQAAALSGLQAANTGLTNYYTDIGLGKANQITQQTAMDAGAMAGAGGAMSSINTSSSNSNNNNTQQKKDGGVVTSPPVSLESGDFIVPAHVVKFLGKEYFDNLASAHGG